MASAPPPATLVSMAGSLVCRSQGVGSSGTARDAIDGAGRTGIGCTGASTPIPRAT
ncbi:hypothetical protein WJ966_17470 [Achromobacter xylosoxidans]